MDTLNFDRPVDRKNTDSFKWDTNLKYYGREDLIPMWVADMDFECAAPIKQAIMNCAANNVYGYTYRSDKVIDAAHQWLQRRNNYSFSKDWLCFCPPGVISALYTLLKLVSWEGDAVMMFHPNYGSLINLVEKSKRRLVFEPLVQTGDKFVVDLDSFLHTIRKENIKVFVHCNPHNPTGKVFSEEEMREMMRICEDQGVMVLSDEIHSDFILPGYHHTPAGKASKLASPRCVMAYSTNKGFNLGGLAMSTLIIPQEELRSRFLDEMDVAQTRLDTIFGSVAMQTAYTQAEDWLDACIDYVAQNKRFVCDFLKEHLPLVHCADSESTYLLWLDCAEMNMSAKELQNFFVQEAGLALSWGEDFGPKNDHWVRMNIATRRELIVRAMTQWKNAMTRGS